jgi:hypothetical protein
LLNIISNFNINPLESDIFFNSCFQKINKNFEFTLFNSNFNFPFINKTNKKSFIEFILEKPNNDWYYFTFTPFIIDVEAFISSIEDLYDPEVNLFITPSFGAFSETHIRIIDQIKQLKLDNLFKYSNKPNNDLSEMGFLISNKTLNTILNNNFCKKTLIENIDKPINFSLLISLLAKYCKIPYSHCPFIEEIGKFGRGKPNHMTMFGGDVSLLTNLNINSLDYENYEYLLNKDKNVQNLDLRNKILNKKFIFGRKNLDIISESITLTEIGRIAGSKNPNESFWDIEKNKLTFRDINYYLTTIFDEIKDGYFEGRYVNNFGVIHYLKEIKK